MRELGVRGFVLARHLLAALEQGVAQADEDAARSALTKIDWVLRGQARRRLEKLLIEAALATEVTDTSNPDACRHVLRAAALQLREVTDVDLRDADRVTCAYETLTESKPPPKWPVASIAAAGIVLALTTTIGAATVMVVNAKPPGPFERPAPPLPTGAYAIGGKPVHVPSIESALTELSGIAGSHPIGREPVALATYPNVAAAWRELVEAMPGMDLDDHMHDPAELRGRVQVLSDQLAGLGLGYFATVEKTSKYEPVIAIYRIEKVTFVRAGDELVRVLDTQRVAPVERVHNVLGQKPEGMSDPIVDLDQVSAHVANEYIPMLDGRGYALADDYWTRTPRGRNATAAASRAIRRELGVALAADLGDRERAVVRLRKLVLASVRHHEAQHAHEQEKQPAYPEELGKLVGPLASGGRGNPKAARARNELSAYISQIASDMWLPQAALWNLSRHAFQSSRRGSPESYAAVLVLEGLARQLDIKSPGPAFHNGEIDRDRLADLVVPLASKPTIELRSAAARLWAELFDEPLVRLVDDRFGE